MKIKLTLLFVFLIVSLGYSQQFKQSSEISKEQLLSHINNYIKSERPALSLISLNKISEKKMQLDAKNGLYVLKFELLLNPNQDIIITDRSSHLTNKFSKNFSYTQKRPSGFDNQLSTGAYKLIKAGNRIKINGEIQIDNLNGNLRYGTKNALSYELKGTNYVLPNTVFKNSTENSNASNETTIVEEKPLQKLKEKLDWQNEDITDVIYNHKYFSAENVPLFSYGNLKYKINPSNSFKGRNDVASNIQKMFYEAIKSTNRLTNDSEENFKASENQINVQLEIQKVLFSFKGKGYQCQIFINADINGHYKNPNSYEYKRNVPVTAKSNIFKNEMSKSESFNSALSNLKKEFRNFIFKRETIQIDFLRIETNKKGKVDKIIFKKPENFINTKKMNFLVLESSDLSINNNKVSITGKVGYCKFKGEIIGDEIICNANNKNKKAFAKYIDSQTELIGLSDF